MSTIRNPGQDDQDDAGLPDDKPGPSSIRPAQDKDGDGVPDGENSVRSSDPIIINH